MTVPRLSLLVVGLPATALVAGLVGRRVGARTGYVLSGICVAAFAVLGWQGAPVLRGGEPVRDAVTWLPSAGVEFAFVLDGLSLLFAAIVLGIGAVVFAYCPAYIPGHVSRTGAFYAELTAFAGGMLGLVLAADAVTLYLFWEVTTVMSFLLIRHRGDSEATRAAERALLVTFLGGLCLLGGVIIAGEATGTYELASWVGDPASLGGAAVPVLLLVLAAVATKSAQVPFHVWLPGAMVAPTPVSAYLHAAAMVKAGIYLLARISPLLAAHPGVAAGVVAVGLASAIVGSFAALRRHDLKVVLAYSTVGQLGLMVALLGVGTRAAVAAALLHAVAHAAYKSTLFLVAGAADRAGTRDLREMSGLARSMPVTTVVAALALASMAGLPPMLGFVSKEEIVKSLTDGGHVLPVLVVVIVLALTAAYSLRILVVGFLGGDPPRRHRLAAGLRLAPAVTAVVGLAGAVVGVLDRPVAAATQAATREATRAGHEVALGLWHGPTVAFWTTTGATIAGAVLFASRSVVRRAPTLPDGARAVDALVRSVRRLAGRLARPLLSPVPAWHLTGVAAAALVVVVITWDPGRGPWSADGAPVAEWVVAGLLVLAAAGVAQARDRFAGLAVLASVGFLAAAFYVLRGAPDLALTQLVVDALSVALIALVLRRLPRDYPEVSRPRVLSSLGVALAVGAVVGGVSLQLTVRDTVSEAAAHYLVAAPARGHDNVVNTIVTGFRPLDTLGEMTVLTVAAAGVVALLRASNSR